MEGCTMADPINNVPLLDINRDNRPHRDEFVDALAAVVDSGRFFGPDVVDLEQEIAAYGGADNAVGWPPGAMHCCSLSASMWAQAMR